LNNKIKLVNKIKLNNKIKLVNKIKLHYRPDIGWMCPKWTHSSKTPPFRMHSFWTHPSKAPPFRTHQSRVPPFYVRTIM